MASQLDVRANDENVMPEDLKKRVLRPRTTTNIPVPKRSALSVINNVPATKSTKIQGALKKTNLPVPVSKNSFIPPQANVIKPGGTSFSIFSDETTKATKEIDVIPRNRIKLYKPEPLLVDNIPESVTPESESEDESSPMVLDATPDVNATHHFQTKKLFMLSIYSQDIYKYLQGQEKKFRPNPNYIQKQPDIDIYMRSILVDWLVEVAIEYKLHTETLYLAVSYVDRFLSHMSVQKSKLQLVGTASMFIASKYEEIYPPELNEFVYITDNTYNKKQVLKMEHLILKVLAFDVSVPTTYYFLHHICTVAGVSDKIRYLAQYICELSLLESVPFLSFLQSEIAGAALCLALYTLEQPPWTEELRTITGYSIIDLAKCITCLYRRYSTISTYPQKAVIVKYQSSKYLSVANLVPPQQLDLVTFCK